LREAKAHAGELTQQQPRLAEYTGLALRASVQLARALRDTASLAPAAEQVLLRQQAQTELDAALAHGESLLATGGLDNPRFARDLIDARRQRCALLAAESRWDEVGDELQAIADMVEQLTERLAATGRPLRQGGAPGLLEGREFEYAIQMADDLGRQDLVERLRQLRSRWVGEPRRPR
jgi:hypothetical protein